MGKLITLSTSVIVCLVFMYIAITHDFSDFCDIRVGEYKCDKWNYTTMLTFILTYLFYGALLGLVISYIVKLIRVKR
jgi:hypothetical protein